MVAGHVSSDGLAVHRNRTRRAVRPRSAVPFRQRVVNGWTRTGPTLEKKLRVPVHYYLSKHFGRSDQAERKRMCPSCGKAWLRKEPLHRIFDFQCRRCRLLSNVAFDVRLGA